MISYKDLDLTGTLEFGADRWRDASMLLPPDKSISHRMILFAALTPEVVTIHALNEGRAVTLLVEALKKLGVELDYTEGSGQLRVSGHLTKNKLEDDPVIYFGPSSAAARLMIGVLSGLGDFCCVIDGDETLRARPFDWIIDPLSEMGCRFEYIGEPGALPIRVLPGEFLGGCVKTQIGSAQAVSALLFAGISGRKAVDIDFPVFARNHTQIMARSFGDEIFENANSVSFIPGRFSVPESVTIPGDPSAAAYLAALFWMSHRDDPTAKLTLEGQCLNPSRLGFFNWMQDCGFGFDTEVRGQSCGELVGDLVLIGGGTHSIQELSGGRIIHSMIDEIPLAVSIAAQLPGYAVFDDLGELTFKETNRITSTCSMLQAAGLDVTPGATSIIIRGGCKPNFNTELPSFGDHRLSMTACVLMLSNGLTGRISEGCCFRTSFPLFDDILKLLTQGGAE